ncbi:Rrf2 family transcriptional regulator [Chelatococcus reniformis]|uniref:HTH-type transcriptional regulator NsrR n=1 Tax=Chelatococcus reniformis TaxID=1494448 RepID=A0A916TW33_9HYPH|nr:Rrf2 family transcriptional regulator [Chelatococcus reniformis]GGC45256.1 HTH-type transcriptional regulator NsrR [Chelatococcus reniformis]
MRLTRYTDYAMRVLLHLGARPERLCSIGEIARAYGISQNHLMKVVNDLAHAGYIVSVRGRGGGIRLGRPAEQINVGALVRHTEDGFDLVDCGSCIIAPVCGLTGALREALAAFMAVLDGYTLADLLAKRMLLGQLLSAAARTKAKPAKGSSG